MLRKNLVNTFQNRSMKTKTISPYFHLIPSLISSCPDLSADERLLLLAAARYEGMSHHDKKISGGFACNKTLAADIVKTHATTRRMIASLRERGFLVDLGTLYPGGPMRRRVSIPVEHVEAFSAKRRVDKSTRQLLNSHAHKHSPANSALSCEQKIHLEDGLPGGAAPENRG